MAQPYTNGLFQAQPLCSRHGRFSFVSFDAMEIPNDPGEAGLWTKAERERRKLTAKELAERINGLAREAGDPTTVSQQVVSKFEQGGTKRAPAWTRYIAPAFQSNDTETKEDTHLHNGLADSTVDIRLMSTWVGLGSGGTGEGDEGVISFSRDLVERELRADPSALLAMVAEGNSMAPDFLGGDQILIDTRRKALAQPGAFCLWDGDGHVVKFIEKVPDSDPPAVRLISANPMYEPQIRLIDEVSIVGRVIWFGRRVQ